MKYEVLTHSSIRINDGVTVYFDPYEIKENYNDADIIFITHSHYDHFSPDDIKKVEKADTVFVLPRAMDFCGNCVFVEPGDKITVKGVAIEAVAAYNIGKEFHKKENNWVGYIVNIGGVLYYVAGDTDIIEENKKIKCDVAFLPVGGTYTMTALEASQLANIIKPKTAVATHFGTVVGTKEDAEIFYKNIK